MSWLVVLISVVLLYDVSCEIRGSALINIIKNVKPVGKPIGKSFLPLTEIPPPKETRLSGRRHMEPDCTKGPEHRDVYDGGRVDIIGDYYDDKVAKTVATVIIPDHIDYKHFQVTTQVPYLTVGPIEGIGYHPSTVEGPSECEKIYQDHMEELYSDDTSDYSEESLEMAKMPIERTGVIPLSLERKLEALYDNISQ